MSQDSSPPPPPAAAPTPAASPCARQDWTLQLSDDPDALMRVLTVLRRRGCRVDRIDYAAGDRRLPGRLRLRIESTGPRAEVVQRRVAELADVIALRAVA